MKQYLYHVTEPENVQSILRTGLRRDGSRRRTIAIYLSENPRSWYQPGKVVLRVRIEGLTGDMTTFLPEQDEILYWGDIEPDRIEICKFRDCQNCQKRDTCGTKIALDLMASIGGEGLMQFCLDFVPEEKKEPGD